MEVEISSFISSQVEEYLEKKLGQLLKGASVAVSYTQDGVEVDVEVDASILADDSYLHKVVEEATRLGICIADMVKEKGWPPSDEDVKKCWNSLKSF
ncbi:MAG: hypothetical protein ABWK05_03540 [Pyrobaculum sp.]